MKKRINVGALALAAVCFCASAFAQNPIVIKFSHVIAADTAKGKAVEYFKKLAEEHGQTLLIVTHDQEFANNTHRIIEMEDGRIIKTDIKARI